MKRFLETVKYWIEAGFISLALMFIALVLLAYCRPAFAGDTDWEQLAKQNWIAEHGDTPPNLTAESEKYLEKMTALLQQERNKNDKN